MDAQEGFPRGMHPSGHHARRRGGQFVLRRRPGESDETHADVTDLAQIQTALASVALTTARDGVLPVQSSPLTTGDDVIEGQFTRVEGPVTVLTAVFVS